MDGADDAWWLRMDIELKNGGLLTVKVLGVEIDTDTSLPDHTPLETPLFISPGSSERLVPPEMIDVGAMPNVVSVRVWAENYPQYYLVFGVGTLGDGRESR